jgi:hypothetical protein
LVANGEDASDACWIKYIDVAVYDYNTAVHSATNKSPFEFFLRRKGFNTVLSTKIDEELIDIPDEDSNIQIVPVLEKENSNLDVLKIIKKYLARMDRKAVHNSIYDFKIGDEVYLKRNFDDNTRQTRAASSRK